MRFTGGGFLAPAGNGRFGSRPSGSRREKAPGSTGSTLRHGGQGGVTQAHTARHKPHKDCPARHQLESPKSTVPQVTRPDGPVTPASRTLGQPARHHLRPHGWNSGQATRVPASRTPASTHRPLRGLGAWARRSMFLPAAPLTTCSSSRLSLESSALCVDSAARTPLPSVTPLSFSPSVGSTWGIMGHSPRCRGPPGALAPPAAAPPRQLLPVPTAPLLCSCSLPGPLHTSAGRQPPSSPRQVHRSTLTWPPHRAVSPARPPALPRCTLSSCPSWGFVLPCPPPPPCAKGQCRALLLGQPALVP